MAAVLVNCTGTVVEGAAVFPIVDVGTFSEEPEEFLPEGIWISKGEAHRSRLFSLEGFIKNTLW
jgi:hypothetical protein